MTLSFARLKTKIRIFNTCVLPVLLYGCEAWCLNVETSRRLDAFHRSCLRHIFDIRWFHRVRNATVYARAGVSESVSTTIRRRRLRFLGHIARKDPATPARQALAASARPPPVGLRRPRDRPRRSWIAEISSFRPIADLMDTAQDRRTYRELVATIT